MTPTLKLVRRRDFSSDVDDLDLYRYLDGFAVAEWIPAVAGLNDAEVDEVMTLRVKGDNHNDLAARLKALDDKVRQTGWWFDETERYGVWLRSKLDNESNARQALVLDIAARPESLGLMTRPTTVNQGSSYIPYYTLGLTRMPLWEATAVNQVSFLRVNCAGGSEPFYDVPGTEPARIARANIYHSDEGEDVAANQLNEAWIGFKTERFGEPGNFLSRWMCGDASATSADTITTSGSYATCTFADETLIERLVLAMYDVTTNYGDQRGEYQVLLRASVNVADTTVYVRLSHGVKDANLWTTAQWNTHQRIKITSTNTLLYNLGTVKFPISRGFNASSFMYNHALRLEAERKSGAGNLIMDSFILVPRNEGMLYFGNAYMRLRSRDAALVYNHPDGQLDGWWYLYGQPSQRLELNHHRWGLPTNNGRIVVAAQGTSHSTTQHLDLVLDTYPRWRSLRGSDTYSNPNPPL